ncbi:MAG TPA: PKD domain containing protein, partial [Actinomycetota bacterium]|nr:PKD domain containing protein [Actinomycetota bacterium]
TQVATADDPTPIPRSNIFGFDATTGAIDPNFAPVMDNEVESLAVAPDGLHVFAGGRFTKINGVAQKSLAKLRLSDGARITQFKGKTNARVKDMALSGGKLYIGGTFATVDGVAQVALAALDPTTGALSPDLKLQFSGPRTGTLNVDKFDITPDGSRLIAIGNWTLVNRLQRDQIVMVDLATTPDSVFDWATTRFQQQCAAVFDTYMRDVDIAPDGSYFVIATTGAYRAGSLCDTASRWELGRTGSGQQPTWVDYTGGDTLYSVAITGPAVYVGGHQRWLNNPLRSGSAGPGAVAREGIAALDPHNGLPLLWNPGRDRGVGVFALVSTPEGLWIGSDTDRIGRYEYHGKLAFMPVAGGSAVPEPRVGAVPGELYRLGLTGVMDHRAYDGTAFGASAPVPGVDWTQARGAFMVSGRLYTGWSDNNLYVRDFDGATAGPTMALNLAGVNTATNFPVNRVTGMFFEPSSGRLYYTLSGDARLLYRYFTPESGVVGAETFTASTTGWSSVSGMTLASGKLYFATSNGNLSAVGFAGGVPSGSATVISGPAVDGQSWQSRGLFVLAT